MPTVRGIDRKGSFMKWGSKGKKYYYKKGSIKSLERAKGRANLQGRAINASRYYHSGGKEVVRNKSKKLSG